MKKQEQELKEREDNEAEYMELMHQLKTLEESKALELKKKELTAALQRQRDKQ